MILLRLSLLLLTGAALGSARHRIPTEQERLFKNLFKNYNKYARPVKDPSTSVKLSFTFELIKIYEVNAKKQRMSVASVVRQEWKDEYLRWNVSEYFGFGSINVPATMIWVPDVGVYNEIENKDHKKTEISNNVVVSFNGSCRWTVPVFVQAMCFVDVSYFPLDVQQCSLRFGSLTHGVAEVHIEQGKLISPRKNRFKNGEWRLYNVSIATDTIWDNLQDSNFSVVIVTFEMERNSLYYFIEMLVPCFLISCLTILGFILPPESGERMSLGMLILLSMTFFQQLTMKMVPLQDFPIISQYFFITGIEIGIALLITTLTLNFYYNSTRKMPAFLKLIILDFLGRIIRIYPRGDETAYGAKLKRSFRSNITNTEMQFDLELNESNSSSGQESTETGLNESSVGLVKFKLKHHSFSLSSSSGSATGNDNLGITKECPRESSEDWVLASKIVDRFSMYASFVIGLATVLAVFLRAPSFWRNRTDLEG